MLSARCLPFGHSLICQDAPWSDCAETQWVGGMTFNKCTTGKGHSPCSSSLWTLKCWSKKAACWSVSWGMSWVGFVTFGEVWTHWGQSWRWGRSVQWRAGWADVSHTSEEQEAQRCLSLEATGKFRKQAGHRAQCSPLCPASCLKQAWFTLKCITIAHNFIPWVEKCPKGLEEMKASHRQRVLAAVHCKPGEQQGRMNT